MLAGLVFGLRVSLLVGLLAAATATLAGIAIGAVAGYFGAWVDTVTMRITEVFQVMPSFILAAVIVALLGRKSLEEAVSLCAASCGPTHERTLSLRWQLATVWRWGGGTGGDERRQQRSGGEEPVHRSLLRRTVAQVEDVQKVQLD